MKWKLLQLLAFYDYIRRDLHYLGTVPNTHSNHLSGVHKIIWAVLPHYAKCRKAAMCGYLFLNQACKIVCRKQSAL